MKKLIKKLCILFVIVSALLALQVLTGIYVIGSQYTQDYDAAMIDKVARLKSLKEPKIVLVGNSNVSFGFISPLIEEALSMPVVNVGLHGGLGNAFHENIAKLSINSGDLIVICHSSFDDNDSVGDVGLTWTTLEYHKELWESLRIKDYWDIILGWPNYWFNTFRLWITRQGNKEPKAPYARWCFNEQGDVIVRPSEEPRPVFRTVLFPKIDDVCVERLNKLNQYTLSRGATLVVAGYPIGVGEDITEVTEETKTVFDKFQQELAARLDCPIISNYRDYFFPYDFFYNTKLHLSEEGARARSEQLIKDIKRWREKKAE